MQRSTILAVARAEMRSVRRLARYWVFAVLSVVMTLAMYLYYAAIHGFLSGMSATIGAVGPRYLVPAMGLYVVAIFLLGLIFLAFDVRARDERDRIADVLDSRPLSNIELLAGRTLGLVLMALAPVLVVAALFQIVGTLTLTLGSYFGEPVEPYSLLGFIIHALSVFAPWCALVVLIAVVARNRLVVVVAALALVGLQLWGSFRLPLYLQPAFGALFPLAPTTSDLVPSITGGPGAVRVVALLVLTAGLLALAAAAHPRRDGGSGARRGAIGAGLVALSAVLIGVVAWQTISELNRREAWLEAHRARSHEARPDVRAVSGSASIDPGRLLTIDLELQVGAPADRALETLLFTLNPGLTVERLSVGGADAAWTHDAGLLEVTPAGPLAPGASTTMHLVASGTPDQAFGYLDSAIDLASSTVTSANIALLGIVPGIFDTRYVALMPGQRWLPSAGADVPGADSRTRPTDHFDLDLEVEVPADWLVAGPGRRHIVDAGGDVARVRFRPGAPVSDVGLLASRFERRALEVAGVELELLLHPSHDRNLRLFADASGEIADRVEAIFDDAARLGLPYPYDGLTLVETPTALRGYGGGWRMDTTQALPGVLLLRENSFPTARFEFGFRNPRRFETREGGIARAKLEALEQFFENDVSGGNLFLGGSRNFLLFQTAARGDGSLAINFVLDDLVNLLLTGKRGYFSPFVFGSALNATAGQIVQQVASGRTDSIAQAVMDTVSDRPSVWDRALGVSLADLDPEEDPERTLNVLALKSPAIARSILDGLGRERTAALLAELLARYRGTTFTAADLAQVARDVDADLEPILGDWLHDTGLPGFVPSPVVIERLEDDSRGMPRYQTRIHVFNGETTPGLFRLRYSVGDDGTTTRWDTTDPVRLAGGEAVEIGLVTAMPPLEIWLQPYLSLNRDDIRLTLPQVDARQVARSAPLVGSRSSAWRPPVTDDIIVDDLDPGFSIESDEEDTGVRLVATGLAAFAPQIDMDTGLPALPPNTRAAQWSRLAAPLGWGKYRRTVAGVASAAGTRRAVFTADLPHAGRWRLAYHVPAGVLQALGTYDLTLHGGGETRTIEFDGAAAEGGWNTLGEFDLPAGEVRLAVSDRSSGQLVVADAVRWQTAGGSAGGAE